MNLDALSGLKPPHLRALLPSYLAGYIDDEPSRARNLVRMRDMVNGWSDETCEMLITQLQELGSENRLYDPHPATRALSRDWMNDIIDEVHLSGLHHVRGVDGPTILVANHLSYVDSTALDCALTWMAQTDVADRIVSVAGPKVYQNTFRRIATGCLATLPVPQSSSVATEQAKVSPRELARQAIRSIRAAKTMLLANRILLIFAEGSRSRTGRLGPFLQGVHRYLDVPGAKVIPTAILGTDKMMPIGQDRLYHGTLQITFGEPITVGDDPKACLKVVHTALADLLPEARRPQE